MLKLLRTTTPTGLRVLRPIYLHSLLALMPKLDLLFWRSRFSCLRSSLLVLLSSCSKSSHQSPNNILKLLLLNSEGFTVYACLVRLEVLLVHKLLVLDLTLLLNFVIVYIKRSSAQLKIMGLGHTCTVWCCETNKRVSVGAFWHAFFQFFYWLRWIENSQRLN